MFSGTGEEGFLGDKKWKMSTQSIIDFVVLLGRIHKNNVPYGQGIFTQNKQEYENKGNFILATWIWLIWSMRIMQSPMHPWKFLEQNCK